MAEGGAAPLQIYKKTSANKKLTMYLARRHLMLDLNRVERVEGVLLVDPEYAGERHVYAEVLLTTRHGRDDDNSIMSFNASYEYPLAVSKIWPVCGTTSMYVKSLQPLVKRLGPNAASFHITFSNNWPPSLILWPTKPYNGGPVGTTYDVRIFLAEGPEDVVGHHNVVRMSVCVTHGAAYVEAEPLMTPSPSRDSFRLSSYYQRCRVRRRPRQHETSSTEFESSCTENEVIEEEKTNEEDAQLSDESNEDGSENVFEEVYFKKRIPETECAAAVSPRPAPCVSVDKTFLLGVEKLYLKSWLEKTCYYHGEQIIVHFRIRNNSAKRVRIVEAKVIQFVKLFKFSTGYFKNVVAKAVDESIAVPSGQIVESSYTMIPTKVPVKDWIAVEDSIIDEDTGLASTLLFPPGLEEARPLHSISVSYYIKMTLFISKLGGKLSLKLPFSLCHAPHNPPPGSVPEQSANRPYREAGVYTAEVEHHERFE